MELAELRKNNELVDLFCTMAEIPSPSLQEENVIDWICDYCSVHGLACEKDDYKNIYINRKFNISGVKNVERNFLNKRWIIL